METPEPTEAREGLPPKQQRFVDSYVVYLNATKAALDAGYTQNRKSAATYGYKLLRLPEVAKAIEEAQQYRTIRCGISHERILAELASIGFTDVGNVFDDHGRLRAFGDIDETTRRAIASIEVQSHSTPGEEGVLVWTTKIKFHDKQRSLDSLAKQLGYAKEKLEIEAGATLAELVAASLKRGAS